MKQFRMRPVAERIDAKSTFTGSDTIAASGTSTPRFLLGVDQVYIETKKLGAG